MTQKLRYCGLFIGFRFDSDSNDDDDEVFSNSSKTRFFENMADDAGSIDEDDLIASNGESSSDSVTSSKITSHYMR